MAELVLVRVDSRLIHGQVITVWYKQTAAQRIIIVDDKLKTDKFMSRILKMAAPPGAPVQILTTDEAAAGWQENQLGTGKVIILFGGVASARKAYEKGFKFPKLQIGGIGSEPGKVKVHGPISLNEDEARDINAFEGDGCPVVFRVLPSDNEEQWQPIRKKYFPAL